MPIYERENARLSYPVRLRARFLTGGVLFDPHSIDRVEIWKYGDGPSQGGVLVDTIDGSMAIREAAGRFYVLWDPFLEGSSPLTTPGVQGPGSPAQGSSPNDPVDIVANVRYYDRWYYTPSTGAQELYSVGLTFFLYPDSYFVDSDTSKWRFEVKLDRKVIVKGENLDIRLQVIPIPLYRALREPLVDYLLPVSTMRYRVVDQDGSEVIPWADIQFTGKEGIVPTSALAALQKGAYFLMSELNLPNGQTLRYPKQAIQLTD